jgi:hypothetical protein
MFRGYILARRVAHKRLIRREVYCEEGRPKCADCVRRDCPVAAIRQVLLTGQSQAGRLFYREKVKTLNTKLGSYHKTYATENRLV